ncbi:MAG: ATP-dependent helicase HrpB [Bryobacter sp.]|nr:ATP-dependent helicase HrpB [Bryobacter sp.]
MEFPIDEILPQIPPSGNLIIEAAPGAGKTTRVPAHLLNQTKNGILVLEPRRLAARLAARRVAEERGEKVGETVGYQVRFEDFTSPRTRLRFLTEGVLNRRLTADPLLSTVDTVILDEFHERDLEGDLALALLLHLQRTRRPDLRLVVMSATLDAAPIAAHLGTANQPCPILRSAGRLFPLEVRYTPESSLALEERVAHATDQACRSAYSGDLLIFLPGLAEIRRAIAASQSVAQRHSLACFPLAGDLPPEEQDRALAPSSLRKAIFSTNLAESSVTIPGVTIVIDSGLARHASDSRSTGLPHLTLAKIPQSSATQRAGRAARTAPGLAIRLYTEQDFLSRPASLAPEILQRELSGLLLQLRALSIPVPASLPWLTPPHPTDLAAASALLDSLGATPALASRMAAFPVAPRLARVLLEAEKRRVAEPAAHLAALLSSGQKSRQVDLIHLADTPLDGQAQRIAKQLSRQIQTHTRPDWERPLAESLLAGYPDRVARHRRAQEYEIAGGIAAQLASPLPQHADWILAVDVEERNDKSNNKGLALIRAACPISPDWLLDLFPDDVESSDRYTWNRAAERIEEESALLFRGLVLTSTLNPRPTSPAASVALAAKVREAGWRKFLDVESTTALLARLEFAQRHGFSSSFDEASLLSLLESLCPTRCGFDQLRDAVTSGEWQLLLSQAIDFPALDALAPERLKLPAGRSCAVHYVPRQTPYIESRLQDFWGLNETPRLARGQVPVLVHLLAPNRRPVQVTQDLASFWSKLYPELRPALSRRYPKHQWP